MCDETIKINGIVDINNGDNKFESSNHMLNNGFKAIFGILLLTYVSRFTGYPYNRTCSVQFPINSWYIRVGTDTTTITTPTMSGLTSLIDIAPSMKQVIVTDGTDTGHYKITYRCIWDAGTISGTIGELGLYMRAGEQISQWSAYGNNVVIAADVKMIARLSSADGLVSPIIIDETKPLIIDWNMNFSI